MYLQFNKRYENEFVNMMIKEGHHCERIAGSGLGRQSVCDCILFKDNKVFLVEVKATKHEKLCMRKKIREQLSRMKDIASKSSVSCMLAVKLKHRGWRFYENEEMEI